MAMEKPARPRTALNECVKVVVRCRPLSEKERNEGYDEVVRVFPSRGAVQVLNAKGQDKLFTYDAAYDHSADTQTIYDEMVRPLVTSVLDGFNGCVFAYGQTGTGKTHTMEGVGRDEGVIPRAFKHIFTHIETTASTDTTHLVSCSYVELYLEDVRDLLSKECKKLTIRGQHIFTHIETTASTDTTHLVSCSYVELYLEDVRDLLSKDCKKLTIRGQELNGFYIPEMTSVVCKSAAEMERVMRAGNRQRAAGRTDMNEHSSRSHAVFLVTIESAHKDTNRIRVGKLNLVDLAGSERQRKTGAAGERLREAARINQALATLGNVISALAENSPHVPYRDSKLTRILQDSLGGNSKTIMIATVGPAAYNYDETVTTLRYAHRAKAIKNKPVRNEDPKDAKLREYQAEIERLRALISQRKVPTTPAPPVDRRKTRVKSKQASNDNSEIEHLRALVSQRKVPTTPAPPVDRRKTRVKSKQASNDNSASEDGSDTASLESEHLLAESSIEAERRQADELAARVRALEERLVQGGAQGGKELINNLNQSQLELEQRNLEIAERKQREVEMQQRIDLEEETTAIVTHTFASLQQEVDHKTQRLKKCLSKYAALREDMVELREAHDGERRGGEGTQAALIAELRRRLLIADSFVPDAGRPVVLRLKYNDDADAWELPEHSSATPLRTRPVASGARRPLCALALASPDRRLAVDNILSLSPMPLPTTTRASLPERHRRSKHSHALEPGGDSRKDDLSSSMTSSTDRERDRDRQSHSHVRQRSAARRPATGHHRLGAAAAGR